jgi:tRNA-specific 2-thiouridylase
MTRSAKKVLVAMSGGVDSSVAASLLIESGCDVAGVFLSLGAAGDAADARRVACRLGIDLFVLDLADAFESIIEDFVAEYAGGRTPNPCIHCNARIKFGGLLERADSLGIRHVATGHYARIARFDGRPAIARAASRAKDQSYALFAVAGASLDRILLPIGDVADKDRVRQVARSLGLSIHDRPESQEICFVGDGDYVSLLRARRPEALRAGEIVDSSGRVVGRHDGYARFTVGQRRGLGVAAGEPVYVTRIDPAAARVTIGPREETISRHLTASGANWHLPVAESFRAIVQIRYNHDGAAGRVDVTGADSFRVTFDEPVMAVTPGQAAVVYDGDRLLGGGWIDG